MPRKRHNLEAGYRAERMNPHAPGHKVTIYDAAAQHLDAGGLRYAVVCDAHGTIVGESSMPGARASMKAPENFCDECRKLATH